MRRTRGWEFDPEPVQLFRTGCLLMVGMIVANLVFWGGLILLVVWAVGKWIA